MTQSEFNFDGSTFEPEHDAMRLSRQHRLVWKTMMNAHKWLTLEEIYRVTNEMPQSVSARLRDFRKPRFGSHIVERRRRDDAAKGIFEYRLIINETALMPMEETTS